MTVSLHRKSSSTRSKDVLGFLDLSKPKNILTFQVSKGCLQALDGVDLSSSQTFARLQIRTETKTERIRERAT